MPTDNTIWQLRESQFYSKLDAHLDRYYGSSPKREDVRAEIVFEAYSRYAESGGALDPLDIFHSARNRAYKALRAFELGRHLIGYEVAAIQGAIDYCDYHKQNYNPELKIGMIGWGEGGMLALVLDPCRVSREWPSSLFGQAL